MAEGWPLRSPVHRPATPATKTCRSGPREVVPLLQNMYERSFSAACKVVPCYKARSKVVFPQPVKPLVIVAVFGATEQAAEKGLDSDIEVSRAFSRG
jgi:hypothetical protein